MPRSTGVSLLALALLLGVQLTPQAAWAAEEPVAEATQSTRPRSGGQRLRAALHAQLQHGSGDEPVRVWSGTGTQYALVLGQAAASLTLAASLHLDRGWQYAAAAAAVYGGYQLADLGAGMIHFLFDGYGSARTPLIGSYLETFKTHHKDALAQTRAAIPYLVAPFTLLTMPLLLGAAQLPTEGWLLKASVLGLGVGLPLAGVSHKYSHLRDKVGGVVRSMRRLGLMLTPREHDRHHRFPNNTAYGQLTGRTNALAERLSLYSRAQSLIYRRTGAIHDSWRHPSGGHEAMVAALGPDPARHPKLPSSGR